IAALGGPPSPPGWMVCSLLAFGHWWYRVVCDGTWGIIVLPVMSRPPHMGYMQRRMEVAVPEAPVGVGRTCSVNEPSEFSIQRTGFMTPPTFWAPPTMYMTIGSPSLSLLLARAVLF